MIDLIVFNVGTNRYAINIENVQRIIQSVEATNIPNAHEYIDGMISYEDRVLKILNFRKLINMKTYHSEMITLFGRFKEEYKEWICALKLSIETGAEFTKSLTYSDGIGKWLDSFNSYDDAITEVLNKLVKNHKQLYLEGSVALGVYKKDKQEAMNIFDSKIMNIYNQATLTLSKLTDEIGLVANSLQKLIIYDSDDLVFAIKVDTIEDIAHVEEDTFINANDEHDKSEFLKLDGVLDLNGVLINIVKTVKLPS